ncbi:MAG: peptidoglycan-associated lipoprotein [Cycloclasticus sp. symbiont of Poecilosclerida sp. M]|nr:MAG: peptidoglycan-associated lipoprotein [Cycloclasticus sp. symbiont of Poecilosclerida sp. M]
MRTTKNLFVALVLSAALAACSSTNEDGSGDAGVDGANTSGVDASGVYTGRPLDNPNSPLATKVIYFEFDSSAIASQYESIIAAHGAYLAANSGVAVALEGHADERGSREYNVALSEKRAKTVQNLLSLLGAGGRQTDAIGYGEEKPAEIGHNESAWNLNRRVELVYPAH